MMLQSSLKKQQLRRRRRRVGGNMLLLPVSFVCIFFIVLSLIWLVFFRSTGDANVVTSDLKGGAPSFDIWLDLIETVNKDRLANISNDLKVQYASAQPFPHVVVDGLFPQSILDAVLAENPESLVQPNGCLPNKPFCAKAKIGDTQYHKSAINEEEHMGPHTRLLANFLKSGVFVEFLKDLSGVRGLMADPLFNGGGIHFTSNGGKLDIHSDYNKYPGPKLERRVNTFLFLNPNWEEDYGGHLELWTRDMRQCKARIAPTLGRFVVFSTSDFSYHGHPHALTAPKGRSRRSMANYYYTVGRPAEECAYPDCRIHGTLWQHPDGCNSCLDPVCYALEESPAIYIL